MTTPHVGPGPGPGRVETFTSNLLLGPLAGRAPHVHDLDTEDNVLSVAPKKKRKLFCRRRKPRVRWTRGASRRPARRGPGELRATLTGLPRPGLDARLSSALSPWSPSALGAQAGSDSRSHCLACPLSSLAPIPPSLSLSPPLKHPDGHSRGPLPVNAQPPPQELGGPRAVLALWLRWGFVPTQGGHCTEPCSYMSSRPKVSGCLTSDLIPEINPKPVPTHRTQRFLGGV